jgi:glyoxylase-like metal-dependent hydrolase (beta-lactamase superfamily II)
MMFRNWPLFVLLIQTLLGTSVCAQVNVRTESPLAAALVNGTTAPIDINKGYNSSEIGDKVYCVTDGIYQALFIVTGKGVVVVDAPPSLGKNILKAIAEVSTEPVTQVIYSHSHADHIGSASQYPANAEFIASAGTAEELRKFNNNKGLVPYGTFVGGFPVPNPTKTFRDSLVLHVGNKVIKLLHINGPAHSMDDVIIWLPKEKIAMLVDVIFPGWVPFEQVAYCQDFNGYLAIQDYLLGLPFNILVAGHYSKLGTRQDVLNNVAYVSDLIRNITEAFQKTDLKTIAEKTGTQNIHLLMETYFDAIASYASKKVEDRWKNTLSGTDIWTYSCARKLIPYVRDSEVILKPEIK